MFFHAPQSVYGIDCFRMFMDEIGGDAVTVSRYLGVHENTVRRWLREATPVPREAVLALFWESKWGRSHIFTDQVNEIRLLYRQVCILQDQYQKAKDIVTGLRAMHAGSANEPLFEELPDLVRWQEPTFGTEAALPLSADPSPPLQDAQPAPVSTRAAQAMQALDRARAAAHR
ncbi:hypothetical protein [Acidovorax sp. Leaf78]|uniref:hypothetical protein n=1 Tax=Acidovorax sp. Leaf78 TaxID=1736237 RepID=UPI0006F9626D|nr:hypothetical protein [Acidovorax sp. Leaf78]KQO24104.1 hypothetical protein ASF16_23625 [Acidovorax sp. Leaf78]